jgi:hypothetical protein
MEEEMRMYIEGILWIDKNVRKRRKIWREKSG